MFIAAIILAVVGAVLWVILAAFNRRAKKDPEFGFSYIVRWPGWGMVVLAVLLFFVSFLKVIPAGNVGIPVLFGDVQKTVYTQGLKTRPPWLAIHNMEVRMQEYTVSIATEEGAVKNRGDEIDVLTSDGLRVKIDGTVQWRIDAPWAWWVYQEIGPNMEQIIAKVVRPSIRGAARDQGSLFSSSELYGEKRADYRDAVINDLRHRLGSQHLMLEDFILRNVQLPSTVEAAIEEKQAAFQKIETKRNQVAEAKEEANRKIEEARGIAEANRIIQQSLTGEYLSWYYIDTLKQLVNAPNNSVIIMPFDQGLIPMINLPASSK